MLSSIRNTSEYTTTVLGPGCQGFCERDLPLLLAMLFRHNVIPCQDVSGGSTTGLATLTTTTMAIVAIVIIHEVPRTVAAMAAVPYGHLLGL